MLIVDKMHDFRPELRVTISNKYSIV